MFSNQKLVVEVEMKLPNVSQDEFDLILMYWHLYKVVPRSKLFHARSRL